jgi:hypothetical protein
MGNFGEGLVGFLSQGSNAFWDQMMENRKQAMGEKELEQRRMQIEQAIAESKLNMLAKQQDIDWQTYQEGVARKEQGIQERPTYEWNFASPEGPGQRMVSPMEYPGVSGGYASPAAWSKGVTEQTGADLENRLSALKLTASTQSLEPAGTYAGIPYTQGDIPTILGLKGAESVARIRGNDGGGTSISSIGPYMERAKKDVRDSLETQMLADVMGSDLFKSLLQQSPSGKLLGIQYPMNWKSAIGAVPQLAPLNDVISMIESAEAARIADGLSKGVILQPDFRRPEYIDMITKAYAPWGLSSGGGAPASGTVAPKGGPSKEDMDKWGPVFTRIMGE